MKALVKDSEHMKKQLLDINAELRSAQAQNKHLRKQLSNSQ